jgi:hypothetical protein
MSSNLPRLHCFLPNLIIFLNEGKFPAWFAYSVTKNAAERPTHFLGKAECSRLIADLENEPVSSRRLLAASVAATIQPEVAEKINSLCDKKIKPVQNDNMSQPSNKRRREYPAKYSVSF